MSEHFFYHSFPRRGRNKLVETSKGLQILTSICDSGLLLTPEVIEWQYPHANGSPPRVQRFLQKRICFTELTPSELIKHANEFGHFAIEYEIETLKKLGALPVFYIPLGIRQQNLAISLGSTLLIQLMDVNSLVSHLNYLNEVLHRPCNPVISYNSKFSENPSMAKTFTINSAESLNTIEAVSHGLTPLSMLSAAMDGLFNFFYPADNIKFDKVLGYYRQREWRLSLDFSINGSNVLRLLTQNEKNNLLIIDEDFFSRNLVFYDNTFSVVDKCNVYPGIGGEHIIEMANRIIVPVEVIDEANKIVSRLGNPPLVVSIESL